MLDKIAKFLQEEKKWVLAGRPIRSEDEMQKIHEICRHCEHFEEGHGWLPKYDRCGICGCNLHPTQTAMNKIAMATTKCPLESPRWGLAWPVNKDIKKDGSEDPPNKKV